MLTMKPRTRKSPGKRVAATRTMAKKEPRTLAELNAWFAENWDLVTERAKANTKRLTGKECL